VATDDSGRGIYRTFCCHVEVDPDSDSPVFNRPECPDCGARSGCYPVRLSRRSSGQYCPVADLPDESPTRLRVYQFLIAFALNGGVHTTRERVLRALDLSESKAKTVSRAISDAKAAGWIEDKASNSYRQGPLADSIVSERSSGGGSGGD
jgi:hypothetical protein